jgi:hypothetical protein
VRKLRLLAKELDHDEAWTQNQIEFKTIANSFYYLIFNNTINHTILTMKNKLILTLDQGTTSSRAIVLTMQEKS